MSLNINKILFVILIAISVVTATTPLWAAEAEGRHEEEGHEHHHSWLHILNRGPIAEISENLKEQHDLIPNTYFMILVIGIFVILATRNLKPLPAGKLQNFMEMVVGGLMDFFTDIVGERGRKYTPFMGSFFIFILCLNILGLVPGFQSPTADLNTTLAMALVAISGVQVIAIKELGFIPYIKHFLGEPMWLGPLMFPLHLIGELAKIMSLSIRLFGNIFGEDTIIIVLATLAVTFLPMWLPVPFQLPMMLFGLFTSLIQALVFSLLTAIYLATFISEHHEEH